MTAALNVHAQKKVVGNPDYPVRDNAEIDINQVAASRPPTPFGYKPATTTGLIFGYYGGEMLVDGVLTNIADSTLTLTASVTNYVEATRAGVVSKNSTGFTAGQTPLYEVTTDTGSITAINDRRIANAPVTGLLALSVAGAGDIILTAAQARADILNLTGALTGNRNVIVPDAVQRRLAYNNTSGAYSLTVKTAAGTGVAIGQGARDDVYSDGIDVISTSPGVINYSATVVVPSSASTPIGVAGSNNVDISGSVTITSHDNVAEGIVRWGRFTGPLIIAHNPVSLILPHGENFYATPGATYMARSLGGGNWVYLFLRDAFGSTVLPGTFAEFGGTVCPGGYLERNGANVSRTTYAWLFAKIGTTWGAGDGSTTFTLPDSRRRVTIGSGGTGSAIIGNAVGNVGGEEGHIQTLAEMANHNHDISVANAAAGGGSDMFHGNTPAPYTTRPTQYRGSSSAMNVMQPSEVALKLIKY